MKTINFKPDHGYQEPDPCPSEVTEHEFLDFHPIFKGLLISAAAGVGVSLLLFLVIYAVLEGWF